jgi:hypothetical protein
MSFSFEDGLEGNRSPHLGTRLWSVRRHGVQFRKYFTGAFAGTERTFSRSGRVSPRHNISRCTLTGNNLEHSTFLDEITKK